MRVTPMIGRHQGERLAHIGEIEAEVAARGVAGADLGERAQPLGQAGVDGGREQDK